MNRNILAVLALIASPASSQAGGGATYSATDADGTVERLLETRMLPNEALGALVSFERSDGSRTIMEYAFKCDVMEYAYLGMTHDKIERVPNLRLVRVESDRLLGNDVRPVSLRPLQGDQTAASITSLAQHVCG